MYATCLGLILKGYSDYDHKYKEFNEQFKKIEVPRNLKVEAAAEVEMPVTSVPQEVDGNARKQKFWDKFKNNLIDLFKEEEDQVIK